MQNGRRALIPAGVSEHFLPLDGVKIRYLAGGEGEPLLFLHGLMGFSFSWSENLPEFAKRYQVYAPDFANAGYSGRCSCDPTLRAAATRMLQFMDRLGVHRATVVGTSHGGTVAMKMAAVSPDRINKLVLVTPAHPWSERRRWQVRLFTSRAGGALARLLYLVPSLAYAGVIRWRMYGQSRRARPGTVAEYSRAIKIHGTIEHLVRFVRGWQKDIEDLDRELESLCAIPVLLVWGDRDMVVPLSTMQPLAERLRTGHTCVIRSAGHLPYEELPDEFNRAVLEWLSSTPSAGSPR